MKPSTAEGYDPATTLQAKATCLYVATKLGDLMDEMVVVGGLVPSLLISLLVQSTRSGDRGGRLRNLNPISLP